MIDDEQIPKPDAMCNVERTLSHVVIPEKDIGDLLKSLDITKKPLILTRLAGLCWQRQVQLLCLVFERCLTYHWQVEFTLSPGNGQTLLPSITNINKLCKVGITINGGLLSRLENYLHKRQYSILINDQTSKWGNIMAVVPLGSVLGLLIVS